MSAPSIKVGDKVRFNPQGRKRMEENCAKEPKRLAFLLGVHEVVGVSHSGCRNIELMYPANLDIEGPASYKQPSPFFVPSELLEIVDPVTPVSAPALKKPVELSATPARINWRGNWYAGSIYQINDVVFHNGCAFIALASNLNSMPPHPNAWAVIGIDGRMIPDTKQNPPVDESKPEEPGKRITTGRVIEW